MSRVEEEGCMGSNLQERLDDLRQQIQNAAQAGESTDITQLDSSYKSLESQLSTTPNRELLIEAMIQNLQLQLNVLNQQLNIINQIKQSKSNSNEKNHRII